MSGVLALNRHFQGFNCSRSQAWACIISMNIFINLVKKFLTGRRIRGRVGAFGEIRALVRALLLSISDLLARPWLASLFYSVGLAEGLI